MYRQATGVKVYLWFKHDAYCCKRLKKILFTFNETKTVFANRVLKWEELIFSPTSIVVTETWIRLETIETIVHNFSNRTREFYIYNLKFELLTSCSTWKRISALHNTTGSTSGLKDWHHATYLGNCLGQMFKSNAFLSITGLKENKLNVHCPGKLSTVLFPNLTIILPPKATNYTKKYWMRRFYSANSTCALGKEAQSCRKWSFES